MTGSQNRLLQIAGVCSISAPIILLLSDVINIFGGMFFEFTIGLFFAFVLFVPAVIGLTYMTVSAGSRLALAGGAFAFFGAMAGASMQSLFRVYAVLQEQGAEETIEQLRSTFKLVASTQMIGLTWPLGLIMLAVSLFLIDRKWILPLLLVAAAVTFPIGRIAGAQWAIISSGIILIAAFGMIGRRLLTYGRSME